MLQACGKPCRGGTAMNDTPANPIFVALLFILRCFVPLAILFGISYLLRRMGLIAVESPEPTDDHENMGGEVDGSGLPKGSDALSPESTGVISKGNQTVENTRSRSK
jgi:hypothetical protein